MRFSPGTGKYIYGLLVNNSDYLCNLYLGIIIKVCQRTHQLRMSTTPITIPIIPIMLMTRGMNEYPVFDPPAAIFTGISAMAIMFDSRDSCPVLFPDTGGAVGTLSCGSMHVPFRIVMAKRENSGLSAR